jgi:radical SAM protein (TIGR04043 family)
MKQTIYLIKNGNLNKMDSVARKKAEMQSRGVRIPQELIDELEAEYNAPSVRTGRIVLCLESPAGGGELVPVFIVNGKRSPNSPLYLVKNYNGGYEVRVDDGKYTDVTLLPRPEFYNLTTAGGVPAYKLAVIVGPGHMRSVVNQRCYYQQIGKPCKFCAVHNWWDANIEKVNGDIAEVVATGVKEGVVQHISLTTATMNTPDKGLRQLVETARLIRARVNIPIMLEFEPIYDLSLLTSLLIEAKEAGVTTVSCNVECFDARLRPVLMPIKGMIPVSTYIRTWDKSLNIFGENEVFTVAIAGIGEDNELLLRGIEMAAYLGVMTFLVPHSPAIGAVYEDMEAPDADRMLSLYEKSAAIYRKYGLNIDACRAGCVRGGGFSAIKDVARFGV